MKEFRTLLAAGVLMALAPTNANATGDISCNGVDGSDATIEFNFGLLPVLNILGASVSAGGDVWSTRPGKGETEIIVGQAAETGNMLIADFTDPNVEQVLVSLRLLSAEQDGDFVRAGTLTKKDHGAHAVVCVGP